MRPLDKIKDIALGAAAETLEPSAVVKNRKRWCPILVKWALRLPLAAGQLKLHHITGDRWYGVVLPNGREIDAATRERAPGGHDWLPVRSTIGSPNSRRSTRA